MDATLMFSANATPSPAPAAHSSAAASNAAQTARGVDSAAEAGGPQNTPNTSNGRIFSGLMRGLLPTHERQDVAAATDPSTTATEPGDLKTELLGAQLNVITSSSAIPDPSSLTAFAKAQGLDEAAVKALFGDIAALSAKTAAGQTLPNMTVITDPAAAPVDVAWLASQLSAEISFQFSGLKTGQAPVQVSPPLSATTVTGDALMPSVMGWNMMANALTTPGVPGVSGAATALTGPSSLGEGHTLSISTLSGTGLGTLGLNATLTSPAPSPLTATALPVAVSQLQLTPSTLSPSAMLPSATAVAVGAVASNLLPAALPAMTTDLAKPALDSAITATEGLDLLTPAAPLPEDAMRIRLVPAWSVVTQQLTQMSGTAMTSAWGALTATTLGSPIRSVALDLTTPLASDSEDRGGLNGSDSGWSTQTLDVNRPGAASTPLPGAAPTPGMAQTLRQEHYQQLADRLGQAMAERLQSQIARGEWKLQMRLNPANLGRIDVELDMHAKGLDAMFRSENPLTRELMVQSMPKLKDTLSQSGMAVASVWVNSDAGRQSDGNPTPQRDRTEVSDTPKSAPAAIGAVPATKAQRSPDGFDVLA